MNKRTAALVLCCLILCMAACTAAYTTEDVQIRLAELGYYKEALTGQTDEFTQQAIAKFQKTAGLAQTGEADTDTVEALFAASAPECPLPLEGLVIGIDPGHQLRANTGVEPVAPGSKVMKRKVSWGTQGRYSGVPEREVNLSVGLKLRDMLEELGAEVVMTHDILDVDITNKERAELFNEHKTDYAIRLRSNGSDADKNKNGAFVIVPEVNPQLENCWRAAQILIDTYCAKTGAQNLGIVVRGDQTGFNWCERLIINIEMGYMTNREEDLKLTDPAHQTKMAEGICDGILAYFVQEQGR